MEAHVWVPTLTEGQPRLSLKGQPANILDIAGARAHWSYTVLWWVEGQQPETTHAQTGPVCGSLRPR